MPFIDARWQIEAAPDEHTEMRWPTRASESAQPSSRRPCLRHRATAPFCLTRSCNGTALPRPTSLTTNIRVPARQLALQPGVHLLHRHPRPLLRRLEQDGRPTLDHDVHRPPGLGTSVMISETWFSSSLQCATS